jgi:hypothetical protein
MTEHDDVIRLLREGRPEATDMELDQIKQRVRRRVAASSGRKQSMKARVGILAMLVTGMVFSTAGAGLALSGGSHHNASIAQYGTATPTPTCTETPGGGTSPSGGGTSPMCTPTPTCTETAGSGTSPAQTQAECSPTPEGGVLPAESGGGNGPANTSGGGTTPSGGVAPAEASNIQPTRQEAAATNSQLPFTGFAAIPVILGGLALLTGGLILRRRTRVE